MEQKYYLAEHRNADICRKSSSGGAFTAITDSWFSEYGARAVVYGCVLDESMTARHSRAETPAQRDAMRGSKYIGSDMSGIMRKVAQDITDGKYVVFSGTPCQVSGLKSFLSVKGIACEGRLLTIEVICHGVGSVRYFKDYIAAYEEKYGSRVVECTFRGKRRIGKRAQMVLTFENSKEYQSPAARYDGFYSAYSGNYILRPSCFQCRYAQQTRFADISIGDNWAVISGSQQRSSLIISNSQHGDCWIRRSLNEMNYVETSIECSDQPNMRQPSRKPDNYKRFWTVYQEGGYRCVQDILGNTAPKARVIHTALRVIYQLHFDDLSRKLAAFFKRSRRGV